MKRKLSALTRAERATVDLPRKNGRGVLVASGYILTAAHCVRWDPKGGMALGDDYLEQVRTADGAKFRLRVCAVEPVADIAVLGEPDHQRLPADAEAFDKYREATDPVPHFRGQMKPTDVQPEYGPPRYSLAVLIYNLDRTWVGGTATVYPMQEATLSVVTPCVIEPGASGGPVVTRNGQLVGIVSNSPDMPECGEEAESYTATMPRLSRALPTWLVDAITEAETPPPAKRPRPGGRARD